MSYRPFSLHCSSFTPTSEMYVMDGLAGMREFVGKDAFKRPRASSRGPSPITVPVGSADSDDEECCVCSESLVGDSPVTECPTCHVRMHIICHGEWFRKLLPASEAWRLLPERGTCPQCRRESSWAEVLTTVLRGYSGEGGGEGEDAALGDVLDLGEAVHIDEEDSASERREVLARDYRPVAVSASVGTTPPHEYIHVASPLGVPVSLDIADETLGTWEGCGTAATSTPLKALRFEERSPVAVIDMAGADDSDATVDLDVDSDATVSMDEFSIEGAVLEGGGIWDLRDPHLSSDNSWRPPRP